MLCDVRYCCGVLVEYLCEALHRDRYCSILVRYRSNILEKHRIVYRIVLTHDVREKHRKLGKVSYTIVENCRLCAEAHVMKLRIGFILPHVPGWGITPDASLLLGWCRTLVWHGGKDDFVRPCIFVRPFVFFFVMYVSSWSTVSFVRCMHLL